MKPNTSNQLMGFAIALLILQIIRLHDLAILDDFEKPINEIWLFESLVMVAKPPILS